MDIILIATVFTGAAFLEISKLVRMKYWYELIIFTVFLVFSFTLSLLLVSGVKIPSPSNSITTFFRALHLSY